MSNKRKRTTNSENKTNKTKKIDSYFKPVQSEAPAIESPTFKKVKLKTRTLLRQNSADNQSDYGNDQDALTINKKKRTDKEEEEEEEGENKASKADNDNTLEEKQAEQEQEGASNEQADKVESSSQIKATQTQELDTQNVPIFSTQTQTQTDTIIGSPITYTFAEDEEEEDCFFDLPKLIDSQIEAKKEQQDEEGLLFSSTQESSLDDFDDIFNHPQDVNVVSLEDNPAIAETDEIKISSNLPDTNLSFPSSTL